MANHQDCRTSQPRDSVEEQEGLTGLSNGANIAVSGKFDVESPADRKRVGRWWECCAGSGPSDVGPGKESETSKSEDSETQRACIDMYGSVEHERALGRWASDRMSDPFRVMQLHELGFPRGIARIVKENSKEFTHWISVLDTSGSMRTLDGRVWDTDRQCWTSTSRWIELLDAVFFTFRVQQILDTTRNVTYWPLKGDPSFPLLPNREYLTFQEMDVVLPHLPAFTPQHISTLPQTLDSIIAYLQALQPSPPPSSPDLNGATPAVPVASSNPPTRRPPPRLHPHITLYTDGVEDPTDKKALERFKSRLTILRERFHAYIIIRLISDDDATVKAFNALDEPGIMILDDLKSEQEQVEKAGNAFLVCDRIFGQLRASCASLECFDAIDERPLTPEELRLLAGLVYGEDPVKLPHPSLEWPQFEEAMRELIRKEKHKAVHPITGERRPWIDLEQLKKRYAHKCALM